MTVLLIVLGAAIGAPLRYLTDRLIQSRHDSLFPWGTLAVNMAASAVLCFVAGLPADPVVMATVGTGFCGALSTYSTFSYETLRLAQAGAHFQVLANITGSVIAGLGAGYLGLAAAQAITGAT